MIENTFGILVQRWRIFRKAIIGNVEMCENIIKAAVVLHNYVQTSELDIREEQRRYCPTGYADYENDDGIIPGAWRKDGVVLKSIRRLGSNNSSVKVKKMRDILAVVSSNFYFFA
ncbi:hypothetical protein RI129_002785 [Pyrocoelia pectoralis]|uniref:DDE Tnp4 domain-containing protein n=1 Tax=Pyrocoelia pectoralis TaxID=417401 RepID=A0AAN7VNW6_9COLE